MGKHILWISDFDPAGSGYLNISVPLCSGLAGLDYELKALGLGYAGQEHSYPFSLIPCKDLQEVNASVHNLNLLWGIDAIVVALDLPLQQILFNQYKYINKKYICICPLENGPLTMSWAIPLMGMDGVFFISELGKQEAIKAGVQKAQHIEIGMDTKLWRQRTEEEKKAFRGPLGIGEDDFVILTVADNQERKNLSAALEITKRVKEATNRTIKHILVTRESSPYGWKLRDLAVEYGINENLIIYERGMPQNDLWVLYAISDLFLLTSKAEGLGLPVMEAMSVGVPVVATRTGALPDLLANGRGILIEGYKIGDRDGIIDVWGNELRKFINIEMAANIVTRITQEMEYGILDLPHTSITSNARKFMESHTWDRPVAQIDATLKEILDDPKTE